MYLFLTLKFKLTTIPILIMPADKAIEKKVRKVETQRKYISKILASETRTAAYRARRKESDRRYREKKKLIKKELEKNKKLRDATAILGTGKT